MKNETLINVFRQTVWDFFVAQSRDLPWRRPAADGSFDPYPILVSEYMLQQTQVNRVIPKFNEFMMVFPNLESLAEANLAAALRSWSGLGYNRRAQFLHQAAQRLWREYQGRIPADPAKLAELPGIGPNTAAAICVYSFNLPLVFIETNIRTVYIHHFMADQDAVDDKELRPLIQKTLDAEQPREWYWALMDYGAYLKQRHGNAARHSKHYSVQSRFTGSPRQIRGTIIRLLAERPLNLAELQKQIADERLEPLLEQLTREGLIHRHGTHFSLD